MVKIIIIFLVAILILIVAFNYFNQDSVANPTAIDFLYGNVSSIPDKEDALYALIGITAPEDVIDFHQYGKSLVENAVIAHSTQKEDNIYPYIPKTENELTIQSLGDKEKTICWWQYGLDEVKDSNECMSTEELDYYIYDNQKLLSRYMALHIYKSITWNLLLIRNSDLLLVLNNLFLGFLKQLSNDGRSNKVFEILLEDIRLWKDFAGAPADVVSKAIITRILQNDLKMVAILISLYPNLEYDHNVVSDIFKPVKLKNWYFEESYVYNYKLRETRYCLQEGYSYLNAFNCLDNMQSIFYKRNKTLNLAVGYIRYLLDLMKKDPQKTLSNCDAQSIEEDDNISYWLDYHVFNKVGNLIFADFKSSNSKNFQCKIIMHIYTVDAALQVLSRYMYIKDRVVEVAGVDELLINDSEQALADSYSYPYIWNSENQTLGFEKGDIYQWDYELKFEPGGSNSIKGSE